MRLHPTWEHRTWKDPLDPEDFELGFLFGSTVAGARLAGLVRLEILYRHGGVYVDMDMEPVRALDSLLCHELFIATEDGNTLTDAVIGSRARHPGLRACLDELKHTSMKAGPLATGPALVTRTLSGRPDVSVLSPESFYPAKFDALRRHGTATAISDATYAVHHWHRSWGSQRSLPTSAPRVDKLLAQVERLRLVSRDQLKARLSRVKSIVYNTEPNRSPGRGTYVGDGRILVQSAAGFPLLLPSHDLSITPHFISAGETHPELRRFIERNLKPTETFVDVGANVGYFSLVAARRVARHGRVVSYEPQPEIAELLRSNAVMNGLEVLIDVRELAVSNRVGSMELMVSGLVSGRSHLADPANLTSERSAPNSYVPQLVLVTSLDSDLKDVPKVDLLKIDCEGSESEVLEGATGLLSEGRIDRIAIEVLREQTGDRYAALCTQLRQLRDLFGATVSLIRPDGTLEAVSLEQVITIGHYLNVVFIFPR